MIDENHNKNIIKSFSMHTFNPDHAGTELSRFNNINIMVADALAPCVTRTSTPMIRLGRISKLLSYLRKDFNYLCHVNVEEWHKM